MTDPFTPSGNRESAWATPPGQPALAVPAEPCGLVAARFDQAQGKLGSAERRRIYKRDGMTCQYCGVQCARDVWGAPRAGNAATIDHRTPRCRGGSNDDSNLSVACWDCNKAKGAMTAEEFMIVRSARFRHSPAVLASVANFARADRYACDIERKARMALDAFRQTEQKWEARRG